MVGLVKSIKLIQAIVRHQKMVFINQFIEGELLGGICIYELKENFTSTKDAQASSILRKICENKLLDSLNADSNKKVSQDITRNSIS